MANVAKALTLPAHSAGYQAVGAAGPRWEFVIGAECRGALPRVLGAWGQSARALSIAARADNSLFSEASSGERHRPARS